MKATIQRSGRDDGLWNVLLGNEVVLRDETYTIACNVEWSLNHGAPGCTECDEIAASILARHAEGGAHV